MQIHTAFAVAEIDIDDERADPHLVLQALCRCITSWAFHTKLTTPILTATLPPLTTEP